MKEWSPFQRQETQKAARILSLRSKKQVGSENPALDLKAPKITLCSALPFGREELVRILAAVDQYKEEMPSQGGDAQGALAVLFFASLQRDANRRCGQLQHRKARR